MYLYLFNLFIFSFKRKCIQSSWSCDFCCFTSTRGQFWNFFVTYCDLYFSRSTSTLWICFFKSQGLFTWFMDPLKDWNIWCHIWYMPCYLIWASELWLSGFMILNLKWCLIFLWFLNWLHVLQNRLLKFLLPYLLRKGGISFKVVT